MGIKLDAISIWCVKTLDTSNPVFLQFNKITDKLQKEDIISKSIMVLPVVHIIVSTTPFMYAIMNSNLEMVEYFKIKFNLKREDVNKMVYSDGRTPLIAACEVGCLAIVKYLHKELKLTYEDAVYSSVVSGSALTNACKNGNLDIVKYLHTDFQLTREDATRRQHYILSPLMYVCAYDHLDVVKYLHTDYGLTTKDARSIAETGRTALMYACKNNGSDIAEYLHSGYGFDRSDALMSHCSSPNALILALRGQNSGLLASLCKYGLLREDILSHVDHIFSHNNTVEMVRIFTDLYDITAHDVLLKLIGHWEKILCDKGAISAFYTKKTNLQKFNLCFPDHLQHTASDDLLSKIASTINDALPPEYLEEEGETGEGEEGEEEQ